MAPAPTPHAHRCGWRRHEVTMAGVSVQEVPDAVIAHSIGGMADSVDEGGIIHVHRRLSHLYPRPHGRPAPAAPANPHGPRRPRGRHRGPGAIGAGYVL